MDNELEEMMEILKKVLPTLISNPEIMQGCDVSNEEVNEIKATGKLSLKVLAYLAGDRFFETYFDELGLEEVEAHETAKFLKRTARDFLEYLQETFPYLEE